MTMGTDLRISLNLLNVLKAMYEAGSSPHYGRSLSTATGLSNGALYPIIDKLEDAGMITGTWEDIDEQVAGRRARRYYQLTGDGTRLYETERGKLLSTADGIRHA